MFLVEFYDTELHKKNKKGNDKTDNSQSFLENVVLMNFLKNKNKITNVKNSNGKECEKNKDSKIRESTGFS